MFYKTINEWKKHIKPINEGGGAGISFKTNINIYIKGYITKNDIIISENTITPEHFDALGYDDGMRNINADIIEWTMPEITRDMILNIKLDQNGDEEYTVLNQLNLDNTEQINFEDTSMIICILVDG